MFREEIRKIPMDRRALRNFAFLLSAVSLLAGAWLWWKSAETWTWAGAAALLFLATGLAAPYILKPLYRVWMILAVIMGWAMTRVILTIVYVAVLTPLGILGKMFGERFLQIKPSGDRQTYWISRARPSGDMKEYERQF